MLPSKISVSMMCADFLNLREELHTLAEAGAEYLHIDVMDGEFVPNYTLGTDFIKLLKTVSPIPLDIHLMITSPERKLEWFDFGEGDMVSIHFESTTHPQRCLSRIRERGASAAIALNPATPISALEWLLPEIDAVLVMTVNPGYAGQRLITQTISKIEQVRRLLDDTGCSDVSVEVDGNVSFTNAALMRPAGADIFVAGTSSVYQAEGSLIGNIDKLRRCVI